MIVGFIVACEVGFWVLLVSGLVARYVFRAQRTSAALLIATPLVDLVLLVATAIDLRNGAEPRSVHGLAAVYLGFSIAFGPSMVRWADARFAHRFAGGPKPVKPPDSGSWDRARHEWGQWLRMVTAAVISCALLLAAVWYVGSGADTDQLWQWMGTLGIVTGIWLIAAPVWETVRAVVTPDSHQP
ncbi:MAG TPA: hypothetical protein VK059_12760 [Nocardioidaceae bacterium]|nr:hypothetical protein [Nocardioidaceae bacterium]